MNARHGIVSGIYGEKVVRMNADYMSETGTNSRTCRRALWTNSATDPHRRGAGPCAKCPIGWSSLLKTALSNSSHIPGAS